MEQEHLDLQETDFGYSLKNILAPTQKEYIFALLGQVQSFMTRLRWKSFFILNPDETPEDQETYGFRTQNFSNCHFPSNFIFPQSVNYVLIILVTPASISYVAMPFIFTSLKSLKIGVNHSIKQFV